MLLFIIEMTGEEEREREREREYKYHLRVEREESAGVLLIRWSCPS